MKPTQEAGPPAVSYRPGSMRIDDELCTECGMCTMVAPEIDSDPQGIPVNANTLEAMAQCPVGAIVWAEAEP